MLINKSMIKFYPTTLLLIMGTISVIHGLKLNCFTFFVFLFVCFLVFTGETVLLKGHIFSKFLLQAYDQQESQLDIQSLSTLVSFTRFDLPLLSSNLRHSEKSFKQLLPQSVSFRGFPLPLTPQRMRFALISIESSQSFSYDQGQFFPPALGGF